MSNISQHIEKLYQDALAKRSASVLGFNISESLRKNVDIIVENAENSKGVMTVALTSLIYKNLNPEQDVRRHQAGIQGDTLAGYLMRRMLPHFLDLNPFPVWLKVGGSQGH